MAQQAGGRLAARLAIRVVVRLVVGLAVRSAARRRAGRLVGTQELKCHDPTLEPRLPQLRDLELHEGEPHGAGGLAHLRGNGAEHGGRVALRFCAGEPERQWESEGEQAEGLGGCGGGGGEVDAWTSMKRKSAPGDAARTRLQ